MTSEKKICSSRCNHCGLEIEGSAPFRGHCPRCDRTFFVGRWYVPYTEADRKRDDMEAARLRIETHQMRRQQLAANLRKLRSTGWYGFQYFRSIDDRKQEANRIRKQYTP